MLKPPRCANGHTMHVFLVQTEAARMDKLFHESITKNMTEAQLKRYCLENGFEYKEKNQ